jgi:hypothetical protein
LESTAYRNERDVHCLKRRCIQLHIVTSLTYN